MEELSATLTIIFGSLARCTDFSTKAITKMANQAVNVIQINVGPVCRVGHS